MKVASSIIASAIFSLAHGVDLTQLSTSSGITGRINWAAPSPTPSTMATRTVNMTRAPPGVSSITLDAAHPDSTLILDNSQAVPIFDDFGNIVGYDTVSRIETVKDSTQSQDTVVHIPVGTALFDANGNFLGFK